MARISSSPRSIRLMTALVLLATFVAGTVTGGSLVHWFASDSGPSRHMGPPMMLPLHELNLSEAQDKKVHEIFERYRPKLDALLNETFPKVRTVNEQIERDVREVLTEEQRRTLDRAKPSRHGGPHDGPPPPRHGEPGDWPPPPGLRPEEHPGPLPSGSASDPTTPAPVPPEASGR